MGSMGKNGDYCQSVCDDCDILWVASSGDQKRNCTSPVSGLLLVKIIKIILRSRMGFKLCWMEIKCEWKALKFDRSALEVSKHGREPTCKVWKYWWIHISRLNMMVLYTILRNRFSAQYKKHFFCPKSAAVFFLFWYRKFGPWCLFVLVCINLWVFVCVELICRAPPLTILLFCLSRQLCDMWRLFLSVDFCVCLYLYLCVWTSFAGHPLCASGSQAGQQITKSAPSSAANLSIKVCDNFWIIIFFSQPFY